MRPTTLLNRSSINISPIKANAIASVALVAKLISMSIITVDFTNKLIRRFRSSELICDGSVSESSMRYAVDYVGAN